MILLVEKNDAFAQVYTAIFKSAGHAVTAVPGLAEALLRLRWLRPDIVVIGDLHSAGRGSVAFCHRLRKVTATTPIPILMIGTSWPGLDQSAPFDAFVKKPFYVDGLLAAVGQLIETAESYPVRRATAVSDHCQFSMQ